MYCFISYMLFNVPEHTIQQKQLSIADFVIGAKDSLLWFSIVTTVDLWRHANVGHWHFDVIFVDCPCTRKLAQMRSSLVNNHREYRYLTTQYSRFSV